jgi:hypothetical protein
VANHAAANTTVTGTASCAGGKTLLFGGGYLSFSGAERGHLQESFPSTTGANGTFTVIGIVDTAGSGSDVITVQAWVACQ